MKAVALTRYLPVTDPEAFLDLEVPKPVPTGRDLLVEVKAVSVNPIDTKVRSSGTGTERTPRILGWDASGVVEAVGPDVTLFRPGDPVYYAGDLTRPGSNAEFQLVDERIVGPKPRTLTHAEAAALPLTAIAAYEAFFDRLGLDRDGGNAGETLLIIGAAGGVGSIGIQLAKAAGLVVIATASRPETYRWVKEMGADHVVNHAQPIADQVRALSLPFVDHIAIFNDRPQWTEATDLIRPQGAIVTIANADTPLDMAGLKAKAATLHWECIFARSNYRTADMIEQHRLLTHLTREIEAGRLRTTLRDVLQPLSAETLRDAHRRIETRRTVGKIVIEMT